MDSDSCGPTQGYIIVEEYPRMPFLLPLFPAHIHSLNNRIAFSDKILIILFIEINYDVDKTGAVCYGDSTGSFTINAYDAAGGNFTFSVPPPSLSPLPPFPLTI